MRYLLIIMLLAFTATIEAQAQTATSACYELQDQIALKKCLREAYEKKAETKKNAPASVASPHTYSKTTKETPAARSCCKVCSKGQPCGNSCISRSYTCRKPPGCAC